MVPTQVETGGGVRVTRTATPFDPALLADLTQQVEQRRGGVLSSGMEYPGRYSRWHVVYVDPCAEISASGRLISARALNDRGRVLLPVFSAALRRAGSPPGSGAPADRDPSGGGPPGGGPSGGDPACGDPAGGGAAPAP